MKWTDLTDDVRRRIALARLAEFRGMDMGAELADEEYQAAECDEAAAWLVWFALRNTGIHEQRRCAVEPIDEGTRQRPGQPG